MGGGIGAQELGLVFIILIVFPLLIVYPAICMGLIAKKLNFHPWLIGILYLIPICNLIVLGVLAFSKERKGITTV